MIDYKAARAVAAVIQTGSFEKAAGALGVTPSAISQRVRQLEERLGAVLVERGVPCRATGKGAWLCRHVEQVGLLEKDLLAHLPGLGGEAPARLTLDIAANADSLGTWFLKAAASFLASSDDLLNIALDDEGHTDDWLRRGRVLAAVTSRSDAVTGCQVRPLGRLRYHATASPGFMARHFPGGVSPAALASAPALTFNQKDQLQADWAQEAFDMAPGLTTHWLPSTHGFVDAALLGMGWGLNPVHLVRGHLAAGRLVELVPGKTLDVALFWQVTRIAADHLTALTDAVVSTARQELLQD